MEFSTPTKTAKSSELSQQEYTGCAFPLALLSLLTTDATVLFSVAPGDTPLNFYMIFVGFFYGRQKIVASYNVFIMINKLYSLLIVSHTNLGSTSSRPLY